MKRLSFLLFISLCIWLIGTLQIPAQTNMFSAFSVSLPSPTSTFVDAQDSQKLIGEHWIASYGGASTDSITAISQTSDGGFVAAGYTQSFGTGSNDIWLVKLNPDGSVVWQKTFGEADFYPTIFVGEVEGGDLYLIGDRGPLGRVWVSKLTQDGAIVWQKNYGDDYYTTPVAARLTNDGDLIILANHGAEISVLKVNLLDGSILWESNLPVPCCPVKRVPASFDLTSDGEVIAVGSVDENEQNTAGWVIRLDTDGSLLWYRTYNQGISTGFSNIQATDAGTLMVVGNVVALDGVTRVSVTHLDADGNILWQKAYLTGDEVLNLSSEIYKTRTGDFIFSSESPTHIRLIKINPDGDILWGNRYHTQFFGSVEGGYSTVQVIEASNGDVLLAGDNIYLNSTSFDGFVMKLDPNGEIDPCSLIESTTSVIASTEFIISSPTITSPVTTTLPYIETTISPEETFVQPQYFCQSGVPEPERPPTKITQIYTTPGRPDIIFVSLIDSSSQTPLPPWYTLNGGVTWLFNPQYNLDYGLAGIVPKDDSLYPVRLFANNGVYRSGDFGLTWAYTGVNAFEFAISPKDPQRMYSTWNYWGGTGGSCWPFPCDALYGVINQSADGGVTWSSVTVEWETYSQFVLSPIQATDGFYNVEYGGGSVVRRMVTGVEYSFPVASFVLDAIDTERLYGVNGNISAGQTSSNAGQTWTPWASFPQSTCFQLLAHPTQTNTIYLRCQAGIYRSTNGGDSWIQITPYPGDILAHHLGNPGQILWSHDGCLYVSDDHGDSWNILNCFNSFSYRVFLPILER